MNNGLFSTYWIRRSHQTDISSDGYVGVSNNVNKRFREHKSSSTNKNLIENIFLDDIVIDVVFTGSSDECYAYEKQLRPKWNIGWNIAPGGEGGLFCSKVQKTEDHKKKISEALKGKVRSPEHSRRISEAKKGKTQSLETTRKISASLLGKKRGPYKKRAA